MLPLNILFRANTTEPQGICATSIKTYTTASTKTKEQWYQSKTSENHGDSTTGRKTATHTSASPNQHHPTQSGWFLRRPQNMASDCLGSNKTSGPFQRLKSLSPITSFHSSGALRLRWPDCRGSTQIIREERVFVTSKQRFKRLGWHLQKFKRKLPSNEPIKKRPLFNLLKSRVYSH